ncbi:MAG: hypothetical protein J6Z27_00270 [Bacteroidales bacterium]|nr:hypothetical protein [Bacteroidales bacterium]
MVENTHNYKQNRFSVPEGYFDNLEQNLRDAVLGRENKEPAAVRILKPALSLTFTFALIIFMGYGVFKITDRFNHTSDQNEISVFSQELDFMRPSQIEFIDIDELDAYSIENNADEVYEFLTQDGYIPFALYNSITSIEK